MAREIQEHDIGGFTYKVQQLGAKVGRKVFAHVLRIVGPGLDIEGESFSVEKFVNAFTDAELDFLCDTFAAGTQFSPNDKPELTWLLKDKFDDHFAGRYGMMLRWLWACLETNYGDFLGEVGISPDALQAVVSKAMGTTKPNPTPPSGPSSMRAGASS